MPSDEHIEENQLNQLLPSECNGTWLRNSGDDLCGKYNPLRKKGKNWLNLLEKDWKISFKALCKYGKNESLSGYLEENYKTT